MESVEGCHIENPPPPQLRGNYEKLRPNFPVLDLALFAEGTFPRSSSTQWEIDWIACVDLVSREKFYLPN